MGPSRSSVACPKGPHGAVGREGVGQARAEVHAAADLVGLLVERARAVRPREPDLEEEGLRQGHAQAQAQVLAPPAVLLSEWSRPKPSATRSPRGRATAPP